MTICVDYHLKSTVIQRNDDCDRTTWATWRISCNQFEPTARALLHLGSFLHYEGIDEWILDRATVESSSYQPGEGFEEVGLEALVWLKDFLRSLICDGKWGPHLFQRIINDLRSYSLLQFDSPNESYSIHLLVHEWIQTQTPEMPNTRTCAMWLLAMAVQPHFGSIKIIRGRCPSVGTSISGAWERSATPRVERRPHAPARRRSC